MQDVACLTLTSSSENKYLYFSTENRETSFVTVENLAHQIMASIESSFDEDSKTFQLNKLVLTDQVEIDVPYQGSLQVIYLRSLAFRELALSNNIAEKSLKALGIASVNESEIAEIRAAYHSAEIPTSALFADKITRDKKVCLHNFMQDLALDLALDDSHYLYDSVIIAGGAVTDHILGLQPRDYDVFFTKNIHGNENVIAAYVEHLTNKFNICAYTDSELAITLNLSHIKSKKKIKVQLILSFYQTAGDIITGFDLPACACMYYRSRVWLTERCRWSLTNRLNYVDPTMVSNNYCLRLAKYAINKGIAVLVPNFDVNVWDAENQGTANAWKIKNSLQIVGTKYNNLGYLLQLHFMPRKAVRKDVEEMPSDYEQYVVEASEETYECNKAEIRKMLVKKNSSFVKPSRSYYSYLFDSSNVPQIATWNSFMSTELENYDIYKSLIKVRNIIKQYR
jgi:hypothetical protein